MTEAEDSAAQSPLYEPLTDTNEIRRLWLHSVPYAESRTESPLECTLEHVKISQNPTYEALSYMWGPQHLKRSIVLDGKKCEVGENLWQALFYLRHEYDSRPLWIDALCINQLDVNERNHQVTQMGDIYSRATRVVAWVGTPDSESSQAIDLLQKFYQVREIPWFGRVDTIFEAHPFPEPIAQEMRSIKHLFELPYWRRLWIIQEVLLANKLSFVCGYDSFGLHHLNYFLKCISDKSKRIRHDSRTLLQILQHSGPAKLSREYDMLRRDQDMRNPSRDVLRTWVGLCSAHEDSLCQDQRDKIFGLRQLVFPCCREAVRVDYAKPIHEIYQAAVGHHISMHRHLSKWESETAKNIRWYELVSQTKNDIRRYQRFHQALGMTLDAILKLPPPWDQESNDERTLIAAKLRGKIIYVSPPLGEESVTPKLMNPSSFPEFSKRIIPQLRHMDRENPMVTRELDLVRSLPQATTPMKFKSLYSKDVPSPYLKKIKNESKLQRLRNKLKTAVSQKDNANIARFCQMLSKAQLRVSESHNKGCKIAIETNGLICFVPAETKVGHLICQFAASNVIAIVQKKGQIIGRAINFFASSYKEPAVTFQQEQIYFEDSDNYENDELVPAMAISEDSDDDRDVHLYFEPRWLQIMTAASETPDSRFE